MRNNNNSSSGGNTFLSLLAILFIGLKLTGFINWPWIWVLSPIWIPLMIVLAMLAFLVVIAALKK